jgi:hypothetical protein
MARNTLLLAIIRIKSSAASGAPVFLQSRYICLVRNRAEINGRHFLELPRAGMIFRFNLYHKTQSRSISCPIPSLYNPSLSCHLNPNPDIDQKIAEFSFWQEPRRQIHA